MKLEQKDPNTLTLNSWNTNVVSAENQKKLDASLERLDDFKPILVRELSSGALEILGGAHRRDAHIRRGDKLVNVFNLGSISDTKAREISLADNERYGQDDSELMERLINSLSSADELSTFLPVSDDYFASFLSDELDVNFDDLNFDDDDDAAVVEKPTSSAPSHRVLRFKVSVADAERISDFIEATSKSNGFTTSDALTNAGDALVHSMGAIW